MPAGDVTVTSPGSVSDVAASASPPTTCERGRHSTPIVIAERPFCTTSTGIPRSQPAFSVMASRASAILVATIASSGGRPSRSAAATRATWSP